MKNTPDFFRPSYLLSGSDNPMRDLSRLQRQMDTLFDDYYRNSDTQSSGLPMFSPKCDIEETETHYVLSFDLPGLKKEDINIELCGDQLCVSGERSEENEDRKKNRTRSERFYGSFTRSFMLPAGVSAESIETDYNDGVLHVAIPKVEVSTARSIKIVETKPGFWEKVLGKKSNKAA